MPCTQPFLVEIPHKKGGSQLSPQRNFSPAPLGNPVAPSSVTSGDSFPPRGSLRRWYMTPHRTGPMWAGSPRRPGDGEQGNTVWPIRPQTEATPPKPQSNRQPFQTLPQRNHSAAPAGPPWSRASGPPGAESACCGPPSPTGGCGGRWLRRCGWSRGCARPTNSLPLRLRLLPAQGLPPCGAGCGRPDLRPPPREGPPAPVGPPHQGPGLAGSVGPLVLTPVLWVAYRLFCRDVGPPATRR